VTTAPPVFAPDCVISTTCPPTPVPVFPTASNEVPGAPLGVWKPIDAMFAYASVDPLLISTAFPAAVNELTALYDARRESAARANPTIGCTQS
jgi:hypothetical protein